MEQWLRRQWQANDEDTAAVKATTASQDSERRGSTRLGRHARVEHSTRSNHEAKSLAENKTKCTNCAL